MRRSKINNIESLRAEFDYYISRAEGTASGIMDSTNFAAIMALIFTSFLTILASRIQFITLLAGIVFIAIIIEMLACLTLITIKQSKLSKKRQDWYEKAEGIITKMRGFDVKTKRY